MMCRALLLLLLCVGTSFADGNRLSYLNGPVDPYYVHRDFARLTTPQWAGEQGVERDGAAILVRMQTWGRGI